MRFNSLFAGTVAACLLSATALTPAFAQDLPPRTAGAVDVNAITKAPFWAGATVEVDGNPKAVFDYVSNDAHWLPWFGGNIEKVDSGDKSRIFALKGGGQLTENIVTFNEPQGDKGGEYGWSQPDGNIFGYTGQYGVISVQPDLEDGEGSIVSVSSYFASDEPDKVLPIVQGGGQAIIEGIRARFGGEFQQKIEGNAVTTIETVRIVDAPRDAVWKAVAEDFGDVSKWASVISKNTLDAGPEGGLMGAKRSCFIPSFGGSTVEKVTEFDEEAGVFTYQVLEGLPPFVTSGFNRWTVQDMGDGKTKLTSLVTMNVGDGTPPFALGMAKEAFASVIGLTSDDLVYFIENGKPHPRELAAAN